MFHGTLFFLTGFAVLVAHSFTAMSTVKTRKNFTEAIDLIQKDNKFVSVVLRDSKEKAITQMIELAKKDVVRRCNDKLQINLLKRIDKYSLLLSSTAHDFDSYSQMAEMKFPSLLRSVRNAQWSEALKIFREVDNLYSTTEAGIDACYTLFKMILDINNGFYTENRDQISLIVRLVALNMDEEKCQETKPILLIASITFFILPTVLLLIERILRKRRNNDANIRRRQEEQQHVLNVNQQENSNETTDANGSTPFLRTNVRGRQHEQQRLSNVDQQETSNETASANESTSVSHRSVLSLVNSVALILCLLFLIVYFACWLPHPEEVSCAAKLSSTIENHHISFYIKQIQPVQERLKSNIHIVMSDISYLALLNRTTKASELRDSIWHSLSFDVSNITKAFKESAQLETNMRKHLLELEEIKSDKDPAVLEAVKSKSATFIQKANEIYSIMYLHLHGHLNTLPRLDEMAKLLVESILVGHDQVTFNRLNRDYCQVIERALSDLTKINDLIGSMKTNIFSAQSVINSALSGAEKQKKSGEKQQFVGRMANVAGAAVFVVAGVNGLKLAITGAAVMGNPALALAVMLTGIGIGAGGIKMQWKGDEIQINAEDLVKTLKAMQSSFDEIMTLTNDQQNYLLAMQSYWKNQEMNLESFKNLVVSHLETTLTSFSEDEENEIRQIQHSVSMSNRRIGQEINKVLKIMPSVNQPTQELDE